VNINISYDNSAATAPSWFQSAVNSAVSYMDALIVNPITVNVTFSWGEENNNAIKAGTAGQNQSYGANVDYATLSGALKSHATSADDQAAVAALPATNPYGSSQYFVSTALQKALGLDSATATATDGFVGLSSSLPWAYNADGSVTAGNYNPVACIEHEISEVLGRAAYLPSQSSGTLTTLDLFRYAAPGQHETTQGAGYFSVDGRTMEQAFGNPGDAADWSASVIGDRLAGNITAGVASQVTALDLQVMDVLGYTIDPTAATPSAATAQAPAANSAPAPDPSAPSSLTFSTSVAFHGPRRATFTGTVSDNSAAVELFDGSTDLGAATVNGDGSWSLSATLPAPSGDAIVAVATNAAGQSTATPNFAIDTGLRGAPYVTVEQIYDDSGDVLGNVFVRRNGASHTVMTRAGRLSGLATNQIVSDGGNTVAVGHGATVTGTGSADTFVFRAHPGQSIVTDFQAGGASHDTLSLAASSFSSVADLLHHTHQAGNDAVIAVGATDTITLHDTSVAALRHNPSDFTFHG
jgi:hypothetical protein